MGVEMEVIAERVNLTCEEVEAVLYAPDEGEEEDGSCEHHRRRERGYADKAARSDD
jgi:hypothetical protein